MTLLLVALGAAVGAPLRYLTDWALRLRPEFPWGTLLVNVTGCLILGLVTGAASSPDVKALIGTGFCGALSTYSTFSYQTIRLAELGSGLSALVNVGANLAAGLGAALLGAAVAQALL